LLERYKITNFGCNLLGASTISTLYNEIQRGLSVPNSQATCARTCRTHRM